MIVHSDYSIACLVCYSTATTPVLPALWGFWIFGSQLLTVIAALPLMAVRESVCSERGKKREEKEAG